MNLPNLASRPFLNTRPVWLVTAAAGAVTLVLIGVNVQLYRASNRSLAEQLAREERLVSEQRVLEAEVRGHLGDLARVPWRSLSRRVDGLNVILREHAFSWLTLLGDIERVMPYQVRLTRIAPSIKAEGVSLNLNGVARSREAMLEFFENLIADERFTNLLPHVERTPEEGSGAGYAFTLTVEYEPREGERASVEQAP